MLRCRILNGLLLAVCVVMLGVSLEQRAYAYVDPGSSLVLFQGVGAAFSAVLFYFRKRVFGLFRRKDAESGHGVADSAVAVKKAE